MLLCFLLNITTYQAPSPSFPEICTPTPPPHSLPWESEPLASVGLQAGQDSPQACPCASVLQAWAKAWVPLAPTHSFGDQLKVPSGFQRV